jgi:predicted Zn-dependent protease
MHKCYNYTKIKKGEPNLEKLKNCLDKWGHYSKKTSGQDFSQLEVIPVFKLSFPFFTH